MHRIRPIPLLLVALLLAGCVTSPTVDHVSAVPPGGNVTINGAGFGSSQRDSRVVFKADNLVAALPVTHWSSGRIIAIVPDFVEPGAQATIQVSRGARYSEPTAMVIRGSYGADSPYDYQVPVQPDSPWAIFRRDHRNSGRSPIPAAYHGDQPWAFRTGKGIFSTPVIDADGTIYVGSADRNFYAINPDGTEKWRFTTGEIIDSAAALAKLEPDSDATLLVPSGDGFLYHLRTEDVASPEDRVIWTFDARSAPGNGFNNWWEGNVALGYDGSILAGNTNFNYYALNSDGTLRWTYPTGSNNWSAAALGDDGSAFWGSNDTFVRRVSPGGQELWTKRTLGFIAASAAVGLDPWPSSRGALDTVYIGSFDSELHALDAETGRRQWSFVTRDHIYGSVALGSDDSGNTTAIYLGSTDGTLYALNPQGEPRWQYDTGDPIRSSPALGRAPEGERGDIVYFGSGNGRLYALNAADGSRRWSFDTTPDDPELRDRNDLNGSPALGMTGVYIGGEHGYLWYVPYDYCLHVEDPRCSTDPEEELPANVVGLFHVTPGGSTEPENPASLPAATLITRRLVVRTDGETQDASVCNSPVGCSQDSLQITMDPPFPYRLEPSADGQFLHLIPTGFLEPGTTYTVEIEADYHANGLRVGNLVLGGEKQGRLSDRFTFQAESPTSENIPLAVGTDQVTALEWTRLAVPLPAMLSSLNQIGFDSMDWIIGTVAVTEPDRQGEGELLMWAIGAERNANGELVVDPDTDFLLPLSGSYKGDFFILGNRNFDMAITEVNVPFNVFQIRGQLGEDLVTRNPSAYAETEVLSIPNFGPYMVLAGLANKWYEKLLAMGTFTTRPYDGPASHRPPGIAVEQVTYQAPTFDTDGQVQATLRLDPGTSYLATEHKGSILLVNPTRSEAVYLDYQPNLANSADDAGNLQTITLTIPAGTRLPRNLAAYVLLDVFPIHLEELHGR